MSDERILRPAGTLAPVVLVTVGTDHHRFDRLVRWADEWAANSTSGARVVVQTGTSSPPTRCEWRPYFDRADLDELVGQCTAFVCHGGPGTIAEARRAGHVPIAVARRQSLGEHVDDHQVRFTRRVAGAGYIHVAETLDRFLELVDHAVAGAPAFRMPAGDDVPSLAVARFARAADALLSSTTRRAAKRRDRTPMARQW